MEVASDFVKEICISLVQFYYIYVRAELRSCLIENVSETRCGRCNPATILICNIQHLFTRNVK